MKMLRWIVGRIILFIDWATPTTPMKRSDELQNNVNKETKRILLYQFNACPFCVKVRRKIRNLNLNIEFRDARNNQVDREALLQGGGKPKVPCLRIESQDGKLQWMYESSDINAYLESRFA